MYYEEIKADRDNPVLVIEHRRESYEHVIPEHWHDNIEITYAIKTAVDYFVDGSYCPIKPGNVIIINSGSIHKVIPSVHPQSDEVQAVTLIIPRLFFEDEEMKIRSAWFEAGEECDDLKKLILEIARTEKQKDEYSHFLQMSALYRLSYLLFSCYQVERYPKGESGSQFELVRSVMDYIWKHYSEDITVEAIAGRFGYSREHLSRLFSRYAGLPVREYIDKVRIWWAAEALVKSDSSVLQVALDSGYSDARGLINAFHRHYGMTPLQFRKNHKNVISGHIL